jgi:uncharacterized membrane protein
MISHRISLLKSLIWRILGVFVYATIFYLFTRKWQITIGSTLVHHLTFLLVFYLHERLWLWLEKPTHPIKALTYEVILGMGLGGLIVYMFTGTWKAVTLITGTYTIVKIIMYYFYDLLWYKNEMGYRTKRQAQR